MKWIETGVNDVLKLKIDGIPHGTYSADEIKQELEDQIVNKGLDLKIDISEYSGRQAFNFKSQTQSLQFVSSGAFDKLLGGESK